MGVLVGLIVVVESYSGENIWCIDNWYLELLCTAGDANERACCGSCRHLTVTPDFCSAKMAQVHWLVESLLEMYKVRGNGKTTLPETKLGLF